MLYLIRTKYMHGEKFHKCSLAFESRFFCGFFLAPSCFFTTNIQTIQAEESKYLNASVIQVAKALPNPHLLLILEKAAVAVNSVLI